MPQNASGGLWRALELLRFPIGQLSLQRDFELIQEGKGEGINPLPPRCRNGVNSPYLPACGFPALGGPRYIALHKGNL